MSAEFICSMEREREKERRLTYHLDNLRVYVICDDTTLGGDVFEHFMEGLSLDLLSLELGVGIVEVKEDCALMQLPDEELRALADRGLWMTEI